MGCWLGLYLSGQLGKAAVSPARQSVPRERAREDAKCDQSQQAGSGFREDLAVGHVRMLAETIGPRPSGSRGEAEALRYLHGYLSGLGYRTRVQGPIPLPDADRCTHNVVAVGPACAPPGPALLIGAHYDSIGLNQTCPGANDNGSGVAALLEVARLAAQLPLPCPLNFVGFGGEERVDSDPENHHFGSRYFHSHQSQPLAAVIAVDMIGVGEQLHLRYLEPAPEPLLALLEAAAGRVGVAVRRKPDPGHSDHEAFARAGLPAVWVQRLEDPAYHTADDTADRVKPVYLQSVVSLLTELLTSLTCDDLDQLTAWSAG